MTAAARWPIGTKYTAHAKPPRHCTVTDILRTYNSAGDLVRVRYVSTHQFAGQTITDIDVCDTTIARGEPQA